MKKRTLLLILLLTSLLFLEIEAANNGWFYHLKHRLMQGLSVSTIAVSLGILAALACLYIAFFDKSLNLGESKEQTPGGRNS